MLTAKTSLALKSMTMNMTIGNLNLNGKWLKADIGKKKFIPKVGAFWLFVLHLKADFFHLDYNLRCLSKMSPGAMQK